jgi:hypothetical protein
LVKSSYLASPDGIDRFFDFGTVCMLWDWQNQFASSAKLHIATL